MKPTIARAMRPSQCLFILKPVPQPHIGPITIDRVRRGVPTLICWTAAFSTFVALSMSGIPLFQNDVLKKFPILCSYYADDTPESDKPF